MATEEVKTGEELLVDLPAQQHVTDVFTNAPVLQDFIDTVVKAANAFAAEPRDMTVRKSREEVKSFAYRIARTKVALDGLGKAEVDHLKELPKMVDLGRKQLRDQLDELADQIRAPAVEWEEQEAERVAYHERVLKQMQDLASGLWEDGSPLTSEQIERSIEQLQAIDPAKGEEYQEAMEQVQKEGLEKLALILATAQNREAEVEELAKLRAEKEEREAKEAEEKAKAAEKAHLEKVKENARKAAEKQVQDDLRRAEREKVEAEERAKRAEEGARKKLEAEQEAERKAEEKRANAKRHRAKIHKEIKAAFEEEIAATAEPALAETIVGAIVAGKIPHVSINY